MYDTRREGTGHSLGGGRAAVGEWQDYPDNTMIIQIIQ
jgi:hypothetical protein